MPGERVEEKWHDVSHEGIELFTLQSSWVIFITSFEPQSHPMRSQGEENWGTFSDEGTEAQSREGLVQSESARQPDLD